MPRLKTSLPIVLGPNAFRRSIPVFLLYPLLALLLLTGAGCRNVVEDTGPGQPVKHRQEAFKEMLRVFEPMGVMLRTDRYEAEAFARMADALMAVRHKPWEFFGPETNYPPSLSKPEVWSRNADFERQRDQFIGLVEQLQEAASQHDEAQIRKLYDQAYNSCSDCHKDFRNRR